MPGLAASKTDPLTGLENRRVFEDGLRREVKCARQAGRQLGLVIFDLDWLERVNGRFGSEAGDQALCRFSSALAESARPSDLIARLGGDEFAVIAPGVGEPETFLIAERARHELSRETDPLTGEGMTVSCGVAIFPKHGETPNGLFRRADLALYAAKQLGRNRTAIYGAEVNAVPAGLKGEQVPLASRIIAVADAYDAMTSDRAYRPAMTSNEARRQLLAAAGTQFYREVVERFVGWLERRDGERRARTQVAPAPTEVEERSQAGERASLPASSVK